MNAQERNQLTLFLQQLKDARIGSKDAEAEQLIKAACEQQADAHYLLVQRSLLLAQALDNAQAEIARLQSEQATLRGTSNSFLAGNAWGNSARPATSSQGAAGFAAATPPSPTAATSWGSGMLGTVATTAAGVVAGAFLFQGIEHLMGNHHGSNGLLSGNNAPDALAAHPESAPVNTYADAGNAAADFADLGPGETDPEWL